MLSSIHPLGERSRHNRFSTTAVAHVIGSTVGGAILGLTAGLVGAATTLIWDAGSVGRPIVLGLVAAGAAVLEATGRERSLPTRRHQVDENWINTYRGWVYGGGFGIELGFGLSTIITTALVHVLVVAMVLVGSIGGAVVLGVVFGAVRGGTVLAAAGVETPEQLRRFHGTLDSMRRASRALGVGALVATSVVGMAAVLL